MIINIKSGHPILPHVRFTKSYREQQENQFYCHTFIMLISSINNSIKLPYIKYNVLAIFIKSIMTKMKDVFQITRAPIYITCTINQTYFRILVIPRGLPYRHCSSSSCTSYLFLHLKWSSRRIHLSHLIRGLGVTTYSNIHARG